jgi:hypothetical protein
MTDIRPMNLGEILDGALAVYRRHFSLLVQLGVLALWLPAALAIYVQLSGGQLEHPVLAVLAGLIQYLGGLLLTAAAIRVISDTYLGRPPQLRDAVALGAAKVWPLVIVGFGYALVLAVCAGVVGIFAALVIPLLARTGGLVAVVAAVALVGGGVWFVLYVACAYALTTQVVVLEELATSFDAFARSWDLTRGFRRKVLATAAVAILIFSLPSAAVGVLAEVLRQPAPPLGQALTVLAALLPIVMTPLLSCVFTLMYYDLRVRREAFDLQVLGRQLGIG